MDEWAELKAKYPATIVSAVTGRADYEINCPKGLAKGWATILGQTFEKIDQLLAGTRERLQVRCIHRSNGTLKIDAAPMPPGFAEKLEIVTLELAVLSWATCDQCGVPGRLMHGMRGDLSTRCLDHQSSLDSAVPGIPTVRRRDASGRLLLGAVDPDTGRVAWWRVSGDDHGFDSGES